MPVVLTVVGLVVIGVLIVLLVGRNRKHGKADIDDHSVTAEALHELLASHKVLLYDVRQPLDLLANSEMIPGAKRIAPKELLQNPSLIPKEKDSVVYCTCPSDKTSREILHKARDMNFFRVKFLKGGLNAWKAMGYPVEPYLESFHLDTQT